MKDFEFDYRGLPVCVNPPPMPPVKPSKNQELITMQGFSGSTCVIIGSSNPDFDAIHHSIAIGDSAECTESYQLVIQLSKSRYTAIMTPDEAETLYGLFQRLEVSRIEPKRDIVDEAKGNRP